MGEPRAALLADVMALRAELCDPSEHAEPVRRTDRHSNRRLVGAWVTRHPGLVAQLGDMFMPSRTDDAGRSTPRSRPPLWIDALSRHTAISMGVARWVWSMGLDQESTVEHNMSTVVREAETLDDETLSMLRDDMRRWRTWAAVLTGWATPPWRPRVACMLDDCGKVGSIVVNLSRQSAYCGACGATWTPETIGVLADYVRSQDRPNG